MAKLLSTERPIIEYELSDSTPENRKWIKAYGRPTMEDVAAMNGKDSVYQLVASLLMDWTWEDESGIAPITVENVKQLDPIDFIEIAEELKVDAFLGRITAVSKKKNSSAISSPKRISKKAKR